MKLGGIIELLPKIVTRTAQLCVGISCCCLARNRCSIFSNTTINLTGQRASIGVTHSYSSHRSYAFLLLHSVAVPSYSDVRYSTNSWVGLVFYKLTEVVDSVHNLQEVVK